MHNTCLHCPFLLHQFTDTTVRWQWFGMVVDTAENNNPAGTTIWKCVVRLVSPHPHVLRSNRNIVWQWSCLWFRVWIFLMVVKCQTKWRLITISWATLMATAALTARWGQEALVFKLHWHRPQIEKFPKQPCKGHPCPLSKTKLFVQRDQNKSNQSMKFPPIKKNKTNPFRQHVCMSIQ